MPNLGVGFFLVVGFGGMSGLHGQPNVDVELGWGLSDVVGCGQCTCLWLSPGVDQPVAGAVIHCYFDVMLTNSRYLFCSLNVETRA